MQILRQNLDWIKFLKTTFGFDTVLMGIGKVSMENKNNLNSWSK